MKKILIYIVFFQLLIGASTKQYEKADFDQLKQQFNADHGKYRLIVLTSPT